MLLVDKFNFVPNKNYNQEVNILKRKIIFLDIKHFKSIIKFMKKVLNFLSGMLIIFCIQYFCIFMLKILNVKLPASILGIVILFLLLKLKVIKQELIEDFCQFILKYMILFFIPMFVGIVNYQNELKQNFFPIILTVIITTTIVMVVVALFIENLIKLKRLRRLREIK